MNTPIDKSIFNETGCIRQEQLLRYRDRQLNSHEQHEVEEHLVDCLLCSEALEGLSMIKSTATIDSLKQDLSKLISPAPVQSIRPWLAAATITGVVLLSVFTYLQYKNVNDERLAISDEVVPAKEIPVISNDRSVATSGTEQPLKPSPPAENFERSKVINKQEKNLNAVTSENTQADLSITETDKEPAMTAAGAAYSVMEVSPAVAKDIAPVSTAIKNTGNQNITYVDNVKVIDYNDYTAEKAMPADVPRSTKSKYQNNKVQTEAAAAEEVQSVAKKQNDDYLDMVADPVILFNNGRYESANAGFDKLLKMNSKDQNAAFYKGLSLYNMKQYEPALKLLVPISSDSASPFMEEAKFYSAQSLISNGEIPKGKNLLEEISNSNGFYSKKAKEELSKIK